MGTEEEEVRKVISGGSRKNDCKWKVESIKMVMQVDVIHNSKCY